jgi:formyltetrahydrofolate deformylase
MVSCPDKKGLISTLSSFISMHDGNILSADQYVSGEGIFFMRLEIEGEGFGLARDEFAGAFRPPARRHGMDWRLAHTDTPKRMTILVSRYDHCLTDLLWRWGARRRDTARRLEPPGPRPVRASPRRPFPPPARHQRYQSGAGGQGSGPSCGERDRRRRAGPVHANPHAEVRGSLQGQAHKHPPFLPAGLRRGGPLPPGVKTIGAAAHYVGEELDAGPIIHQDVAHVYHRDTVEDLVRLGREVERRVLARAVRLHLEDRALVDGNRIVFFE